MSDDIRVGGSYACTYCDRWVNSADVHRCDIRVLQAKYASLQSALEEARRRIAELEDELAYAMEDSE